MYTAKRVHDVMTWLRPESNRERSAEMIRELHMLCRCRLPCSGAVCLVLKFEMCAHEVKCCRIWPQLEFGRIWTGFGLSFTELSILGTISNRRITMQSGAQEKKVL
jgi:hypothetical protein